MSGEVAALPNTVSRAAGVASATRITTPAGIVDLAYNYGRWPAPADVSESRRGADDMLDCIENAIRQGLI
jgi:hypothetical protein